MHCKHQARGMKHATNRIEADTLVTGATGFLGRWLVAALTGQGRRVVAVARRGQDRHAELAAFVDAHDGDSANLFTIDGDLTLEGLGIKEELVGVRDVFHLAAVFAFRMKPQFAKDVNVLGSLRVAQWAREQPTLRRLIQLGGYRATLLPQWLGTQYPLETSTETRLYKTHGAYEASKLESYIAMKQFAAQHKLPYTAVHPSTVIGHSQTGETSQTTGLGEVVEKLWLGKLPALAGTADTNVPLISVDYLAAFLCSVPDREESLGQDLCVLDPATPRLPKLVEAMATHLGVRAPTRLVSTRVLARIPSALSGMEPESLTFLTEDTYDTRSADAHAEAIGLERPDISTNIERWVERLVSTDFGRVPHREAGRFVETAGASTFTVGSSQQADAVLLHGLPWDSGSMRDLADALPFRAMRADLPGLGRSSKSATSSDVQWLSELLDAQESPTTLVGHSYSSGLALRLAQSAPEKVRELILISPFFLQARAPWFLRQSLLASRLLRSGTATQLQARLLEQANPALLHDAVRSAHQHLQRRGVACAVAKRLARASQLSEREELSAQLATAKHPILIVHGEHDVITGPVPHGIRVVAIEGAGHTPHLDAPRQVANAILAWRQDETRRSETLQAAS